MPDNPQDTAAIEPKPGWFALPDHRIVEFEGRDAAIFAQAQFMNDVAALGDDRWQWNGWLTPKGRVVALFALLRLSQERLWLLLPDHPPEELVEGLRRYVFRSRLRLSVREDLYVAGSAEVSRLGSGNHWVGDAETGIELDYSGAIGDTTGRMTAAGEVTPSRRRLRIGHEPAAADPTAQTWWKAADLMHGWPRLDASQREQWTPQQLSLERLHAYSVKKGCYPGQEIVARTHFLGQAKRGLALIRARNPLTPGADLPGTDPAGEGQPGGSAKVIAVAGDVALAVVTTGTGTGETTHWRTEPLRDGLAR